jgi:hypothetical protein
VTILDLDILFLPCPKGRCHRWLGLYHLDKRALFAEPSHFLYYGMQEPRPWHMRPGSSCWVWGWADGVRYRPEAVKLGGKAQFPYMVSAPPPAICIQ